MLILNSDNNTKEDLDKISENCPLEIFAEVLIDCELPIFSTWEFVVKVKDKVYSNLKSWSFKWYRPVLLLENLGASFRIYFSNIPKHIDRIDLALTATYADVEDISSKVKSFNAKIEDSTSHTEWVSFCYDNSNSELHSKQVSFGTFARVTDGWKFYPNMQDVLWCPKM